MVEAWEEEDEAEVEVAGVNKDEGEDEKEEEGEEEEEEEEEERVHRTRMLRSITKSIISRVSLLKTHSSNETETISSSLHGLTALSLLSKRTSMATATTKTIGSAERQRLETEINQLFSEAREEIESALESVGTTYFNEDALLAKGLVSETIERYDLLLSKCEASEREKVQRAMGLKMEQLKAEVKLIDSAHDDHD